jgi:hypothetical protein
VVQAVAGSSPVAHPHKEPANQWFLGSRSGRAVDGWGAIGVQILDESRCTGRVGLLRGLSTPFRAMAPVENRRFVRNDSEAGAWRASLRPLIVTRIPTGWRRRSPRSSTAPFRRPFPCRSGLDAAVAAFDSALSATRAAVQGRVLPWTLLHPTAESASGAWLSRFGSCVRNSARDACGPAVWGFESRRTQTVSGRGGRVVRDPNRSSATEDGWRESISEPA